MKRRGCRLTLIALLTIVALLLALMVWGGLAARRWVGRAKQDVYVLRGLLADDPQWWPSVEQVREARLRLEEADVIVGAANRSLGGLAVGLERQSWWPWLSKMGAFGHYGLDATQRLTRVAWWSVLRIESSVDQYGTINTASGVEVLMDQDPLGAGLQEVYRQRGQLVAVRNDLAMVQQAMPKPFARHQLAGLVDPFAMDLALLGLEAIGPEGERTYLVLIQNSDEMRATGGFISSVAVVRIADHTMASMDYMNSYDVEAYHEIHPPAPEPQSRIMDNAILLFRDANWSPDWPTSAEVAGALYQMDMGEEVSGVIAIDAAFVKMMLEALGPIELPAQGVTVGADNVIETIVGFWENPEDSAGIGERDVKHGEWLAHRKDFGKPLIEAGIQRLYAVDGDDIVRLLAATEAAARSKHLLVWGLGSRGMQQAATRAGLDGALSRTTGDFLMMVDTNMGWNKVDRNIERSLDYLVDLDSFTATATLSYRNVSPVEIETCEHRAGYKDTYEQLSRDCYWNYQRILVPMGAELSSVAGGDAIVDQGREGDRVAWGTLIVAPPGQVTTLEWQYKLPAFVFGPDAYRLVIQKQPGTENVPVSITVQGADLTEPLPDGWRTAGSEALFEATLDADLVLMLPRAE